MRWPWKRPKPDPKQLAAARAALEAARLDRPRVEEVARRARRLSERNGFGEAITRAMGGTR